MNKIFSLVGLMLCFSLTACGGEEKASSKLKDRYPEKNRTVFIDSCVKSGNSKQKCEAVLQCIEGRVSIADFIKADTALALKKEISDEVASALGECRAEAN